MKKLLLISLMLMSTFTNAYYGNWKYQYFYDQSIDIRISTKTSIVAPTYGLENGGVIARDLHIDVFNSEAREIFVKLYNKVDTSTQLIEFKLIKAPEGHFYAKVPLAYNQLYIKTKHDGSQFWILNIDGRQISFLGNLMNAY